MSLIKAKQMILDQVKAALEFVPDDPVEAERQKPWLAKVLNVSLMGLTYKDLNVYQVNAANALFGPAYSLVLGGDGDTAGEEDTGGDGTVLRAV